MKSKLWSVFLTLAVIGMLIFSGPAQAVSVSIGSISTTTPEPGDVVTFTAEVEVNIDENIPVTQVELQLTGAANISCYYAMDGTLISSEPVCAGFQLTRDPIDSYRYSPNRYGFGNSVDGPANATYGPGYGYGYGYEYGYGYGYGYGASPLSLRYFISWNTTGYGGDYDIRFKATAQNGQLFSYASNPVRFSVTTPPISDTAAPDVSATVIGLTPTTADIQVWASEMSVLTIDYGLTTALGTIVPAGNGMWSITTLTGLTPSTLYYFTATACDSSSNCATTPMQSFTTPAIAVPPIVTASVTSVTSTSGTIEASASETVTFTTFAGTNPANLNIIVGGGTGIHSHMILGGLTPVTTYHYVVQGCDLDGLCVNTTLDSFTTLSVFDTDAPSVHANIVSTTGTTAVIEATSDEIVDFTMFIGTSPDNLDWIILALDTDYTLTTVAGLTPVTRYWYYVKACDAENNCAQTDVASFTSSVPSVTAETYNETHSSVLFNMTSDVPVRFIIYFGPGNMTSTAVAGTLDTTVNDYMLAELQEGTLYNYKVIGCTADDICGPTEPVVKQFTTLGVFPSLDVELTYLGMTDVTFSGRASESVAWRLQWDVDAPEPYSFGTATYGTGVSTNMGAGTLMPGTTYHYEVQGCDAAGLCSYVYGTFTTLGTGGNGGGNGGGGHIPGTPELSAIVTPDVTTAALALTSQGAVNFTVRYGVDIENLTASLTAEGASAALTLTGLSAGTQYFAEIQACAAQCTNMSISFTTLDSASSTLAFVRSSGGGSGGTLDCSWGYDLVDGRCVREDVTAEELEANLEAESDNETFEMYSEELAGTAPATEPTSDFITGRVIGGDLGSQSWLWLGIFVGLIAIGGAAYFVRKY
jgi:hypothetical protein